MIKEQDLLALTTYVTDQMKAGASEQQLRGALIGEGGWSIEDVDEVFRSIGGLVAFQNTHDATLDMAVSPVVAEIVPAEGAAVERETQSTSQQQVKPITEAPAVSMQDVAIEMGGSPPRARVAAIGIAAAALLVATGAAAYFFVGSGSLFARAPYDESNLISGTLLKLKDIKSSAATLTGKFVMETRDEGARPFVLFSGTESVEMREAHKRDYARLQHVYQIQNKLLFANGELGYPNGLSEIYSVSPVEKPGSTFLTQDSLPVDPKSQLPYAYRKMGLGYSLTVELETDEALDAVTKTQAYKKGDATVSGRVVTVNDRSLLYVSISPVPQKSFFENIAEIARRLPPEMNTSVSVRTVSEVGTLSDSDFDFAFDADADFGDMSYKVAFDMRKVDETAYARIRNMPGIVLAFIPIPKDVWVSITKEDAEKIASSSSRDLMSELSRQSPALEKRYDENQKKFEDLMRNVIVFAEEEKLLRFKSQPVKETIDDRKLYRYDLAIRKEAIVPFLEKVATYAEGIDGSEDNMQQIRDEVIPYLESEEFTTVFNFIDENLSIKLWVDADGYPAHSEYSFRIVPPDTATTLSDKQARMTMVIDFDDINKPVKVEAPTDPRPLSEVLEEGQANEVPKGPGSFMGTLRQSAGVHMGIGSDEDSMASTTVPDVPGIEQ